jgi:hypothetical protein
MWMLENYTKSVTCKVILIGRVNNLQAFPNDLLQDFFYALKVTKLCLKFNPYFSNLLTLLPNNMNSLFKQFINFSSYLIFYLINRQDRNSKFSHQNLPDSTYSWKTSIILKQQYITSLKSNEYLY